MGLDTSRGKLRIFLSLEHEQNNSSKHEQIKVHGCFGVQEIEQEGGLAKPTATVGWWSVTA